MQNLNKENFFDEMQQKYPKATDKFCAWIDEYKARVGWNKLFRANEDTMQLHSSTYKFHDIPIEMQLGIIALFLFEQSGEPMDKFDSIKKSLEDDFEDLESVIKG